MITLDPTLQTAQDSIERSPIIKLVSSSFTESIPFEGQEFNTSTETELNPYIIEMSSGRLAAIVSKNDDLVLRITDTGKNEWTDYNFYNPAAVTYLSGSLIELPSGDLGIIIIDKPSSSNYRLRRMVITTSGAVVTSVSDIFTTSTWIQSPSVEYLSNSTYILVYSYKNSSNEYSIQKRTSSDFLSWGSATTISPTGLDNTYQIANTQISQLASDEIFIVFDYVESISGDQQLINCYEVRSNDVGVTWTTPTKVTDYDDFSAYGKDPTISERSDGSIEFIFQEEKELLLINKNTLGWDTDEGSFAHSIYFDSANETLIAKQLLSTTGMSIIKAVFLIDVPNWEITQTWSASTSPSFTPIFSAVGSLTAPNRSWDFGKYSVTHIATLYRASSVLVVDTVLDTITTYQIGNPNQWALSQSEFDPWGIYLNLITPLIIAQDYVLTEIIMSPVDSKLYLLYRFGYLSSQKIHIGWIDLEEQPDPITGMYTWNVLFDYSWSQAQTDHNTIRFFHDIDRIVLSSTGSGNGVLQIFNFAGARLYNYDFVSIPSFHRHGMSYPVIIDNHVYGGIGYDGYEPLYGQSSYYGLMDIDLDTGIIRYHRPSWATQNNYNLWVTKDMGDGRILIATKGEGIAIFTIITETWVIYNSTTLPGIPSHTWFDVEYDSVNQIIFASGGSGIIAFPENGVFQQVRYITGENSGSWSYGSSEILVNGYTNSQPYGVIDSDNILWCLWTYMDAIGYSTYWSHEGVEKDLTPYLINSPVTIKWDISSPSSLNFTLSHGHLFDTTNTMSLLSIILKQGRKIEVQLGELISGTEYFQNQGSFIVTDIKLKYSKGSYPTVIVTCEDYRSVWKQSRIVASDYYSNQLPDAILSDLLQEHANIDVLDIDFPVFVGGYSLYHQFIDQDLNEMLMLILDHFNYFLYVDVDSKYTSRRINLSGSVDHVYSGSELINFTPDSTYSNFLNRIVVKGEGRYELEVLYPIEIVAQLSGTVGWWGGTEIKRVYYSEDREKKCRNPYLEIKVSIQEFEIFTIQGGGKEYISNTDTEEYYVEITIESPNLVAMIIGVALAILTVGIAAMFCGFGSGICGPYIFALTILSQIMAYMLGTIAQYDYEIWASPVGSTKQTFQAQADDEVFQRELNGLIVSEEIDDPFCYTIAQCQNVANNELNIVKAQRKGVSFDKIAHLQDEVGDIIEIIHPYTGLTLKVFIPSLTRIYQKGTDVRDIIGGWLL